ncbi:GNAT family N-acetyltransferase [Metabacillus litoralis]|uniref:GNAT family N-acetyltransferase n=1 Tax=Metabacillus litoralis TaxID=152268 RepID=UPI001CFEA060|nr:GNAT family N-acetyltransferase [Metabacillus litoralis]
MNITFKQANTEDIPFLWDMLYEAIYVNENEEKPPRSILNNPELAKYVENWGRGGDLAIIAKDENNQNLGAVWIRLFDDTNKTYGYVDHTTPILSMAILPEFRGKGIGSKLLKEICFLASTNGYKAISLSVDPANKALTLYERIGFKKVGINGTSWDMKLSF